MKICPECKINKTQKDFYATRPHICIDCTNTLYAEKNKKARRQFGTYEYYMYRWCNLKRKAKTREIVFNLSFESFKKIYAQGKCFYCEEPMSSIVPSVDRVDSKVEYRDDNCVLSCWECNKIKFYLSRVDARRMLVIANKLANL